MVATCMLPLQAQKKGLASINARDLKSHMMFLASDELEGRNTGEPGLEIAARYLAAQADLLGLKPAEGGSGFFQHYIIQEQSYDREHSFFSVHHSGRDPVVNQDPFYMLSAIDGERVTIEGEVVFAGYGITDEENGYDDLAGVDIRGKVVLLMSRAPLNEEGTSLQFGEEKWGGMMSYRSKLRYINKQDPKAVLMVFDPKSGIESIGDISPGYADYLSKSMNLKEPDAEISNVGRGPMNILIHRSLADQLMEASGKSLQELQMEIDRSLIPKSFLMEGTRLRMELNLNSKELEVSNVFGLIEGSDPDLKDELILYVAHYDHMGTDDQGGVFNGADDNASGSVALIEIAEAFLSEKRPPKRSIGFLWVSAEELGLFGSKYFADHPMVPEEGIVAVINLDMIGRTKSNEDEQSKRHGLTIVGADTVKVIGALQSKVLMEINQKTLAESGLVGNYNYNDPEHPEQYFYRSDHINFARMDIPVLFYSTGTHRDYHMVSDVEARIDYEKYLKMTRFSFQAGYNVARYRGPIEVDNPMSGW